ncbi:hypothetical protein MGM1_5160 [Candidatus Malacoplasma girerdii]|uniref:Uncharacterized protein n=1 Tax=Candidatus Malacoplasma girerdii TaxID=1318617 RepID=A0A097STF3_9BACT|nr:hypothetical protein MGM1_5160 [Candidatus Malacoplasma girerdii]ASJ89391.1 MAG: hypothetical protein B1217_0515 [Candidatus Malacoplasma girerdii]
MDTNKQLDEKIVEKNEEVNCIDQISVLYNEGINSTDKIAQSRRFNFFVIVFSLFASTCIGVILCYLLYVFA